MFPLRTMAVAALLTGAAATAFAGTITLTYTGGQNSTDWSNPKNWGGAAYPQNGLNGSNYAAVFGGANQNAVIGLNNATAISVDSLQTGGQGTDILVAPGSSLSVQQLTGSGLLRADGAALNVQDGSNFHGQLHLDANNTLTTAGLGGGVWSGVLTTGDPFVNGINPLPPYTGQSAFIGGISGLETVTNTGIIGGSVGGIGNLAQLINQGVISGTKGLLTAAFDVSAYKFDNTNGTLQVDSGATLRISSPHFQNYDGSTLSGGTYDLSGNLALAGNLFNVDAGTNLIVRNGGNITNGGAGILQNLTGNAGDITVTGTGASLVLNSASLTNTGILTSTAGGAINTGLLNNAAYTVVNAGSTLNTAGFINSGVIQVAGVADLRAGTLDSFRNLSASDETLHGGFYNLTQTGTLIYDAGSGAHAGAILHIGADATLDLQRGGQLQYGPVLYDALALLNSNAGTLQLSGGSHSFAPVDGTFVNDTTGTLQVAAGASARIYGALTNSGAMGVNGALAADSGLNDGTLTVGGVNARNPASATFFGTLANNGGTVEIDSNGEVQAAQTYSQTAGMTTLVNGLLQAPSISLNGGVLGGYGNIAGDVDNSGGTVAPVSALLEQDGNYTQESGGTLFEGLGDGGLFFITGNAALSGTFHGFDAAGGNFHIGDTFRILHFDGSLIGNFMAFDLPSLAGLQFREDIEANDINLIVEAAQTTATPEPSFFWLGAAMIAGAAIWRRRVAA